MAVMYSVFVVVGLAWFFYRSMFAAVFLIPVGFAFFHRQRMKKTGKQRQELTMQFLECIMSVSVLVKAGYSAENAFLECEQDMRLMFGADSLIGAELRQIRRGLHINISLEELLEDFGKRSDVGEIIRFAQVFQIAKKSGGNLSEVIHNSTELIGNKVAYSKEAAALLGGKQMELAVMRIMPFLIVFYIDATGKGFFDCLYHNLKGNCIMTGCLIGYLAAYALGDFILGKLTIKL